MALVKPLVDELGKRLGQWGETLFRGGAYSLDGQVESDVIDALFSQIHTEYCQQAIGRDASLQAIALAMTVQIVRRIQRADAHSLRDNKGYQYLVRFEAMVERRFRDQPSIEQLAGELGISGTYLNILCQRHGGTKALQVLNGRLMLEAKRLLVYSTMTISQIADELGFSDPAYFTRAFKRHAGMTPKDYRIHRG
jgi:AraC-type DNA-binding domain-containing proteins